MRGSLAYIGGRTASILLFSSVILKSYEMMFSKDMEVGGILLQRWLVCSFLSVELVLAAFLWIGISRTTIRIMTIGLFLGFSGITLVLSIYGWKSCGCFGVIQVPPYVTFMVDVMIVVALGFEVGRDRKLPALAASPRQIPLAVAALVLSAIWATIVYVMPIQEPKFEPVILSVGRPHSERSFKTGDYVFIAYRGNCPKCKEKLASWTEGAELDHEVNDRAWAFLDVGGDSNIVPVTSLPIYRQIMPHMETPAVLVVRDGKVIERFVSFDDFFLESSLVNVRK